MIQNKQSLVEKKEFTIQKYKKRLLIQVIVIFLICLLVILERVFYQIIIDAQQSTLSSLQTSTHMTKQKHGIIVPVDIDNSFLQLFGYFSKFPFKFLFITHIFATLYVAFDSFLATKLVYATMAIIYIVSFLQMFYAGQRPFWESDRILTSACLPSYNHPSMGIVLMLFIPSYGYFCWNKKTDNFSLVGKNLKHLIFGISTFILTGIVQFMNYFIGNTYLINIFVSIALAILLFTIVYTGDSLIQNAVKKSTIMTTQAKKYIFYWLLLISLLCTMILIIYSGEDLFLDINWIENFLNCTRYLQYNNKVYNYNQIIGPWFNLTQTASLFAWLGIIFGSSMSFRKINNIYWASGCANKRIIRALIANLFIIPSWIFVIFIENQGNWIKNIGLNVYIIDCLHFFILYLVLFGYVPTLIFDKLFRITNKEKQDYILMEQKK